MVFAGYSGFPPPVTTGYSRLSRNMAEKKMKNENSEFLPIIVKHLELVVPARLEVRCTHPLYLRLSYANLLGHDLSVLLKLLLPLRIGGATPPVVGDPARLAPAGYLVPLLV